MPDETVDDTAIRGMVSALKPEWRVESIRRGDYGTDLVAFLDIRTQFDRRTAVLKATTAGFVRPAVARSEPRLLRLVGRETAIPVPDVLGFADSHSTYPEPFYLLEHVDGENLESNPDAISPRARERVVGDAGRNLARLHDLATFDRVGRIGVRDGDLAVLNGSHGRISDFRAWIRAETGQALDALADGTYYPDLAVEPDRFADLVSVLRDELDSRLDTLTEPEPPRYCHWDYRYGNLLVDPETGQTRAVLDWANLLAAEPAYNLAKTESFLIDSGANDSPERAAALRKRFRDAYADERDNWTLTPEIEARIETYLLKCRVDAMACLPLWLRDATPEQRNERERDHRAFVATYL